MLAIDRLLSTAAILSVFVAGLAFNRVTTAHEGARHEHTQEAISRFFDLPVFLFFGTVLPWQGWSELGWIVVPLLVLVLLVRRLPAWLLLGPLLHSVRNRREACFNGWFGPIGVAALFYAAEVRHDVDGEVVWIVASLVVFGSILLHGITATPWTRRFGRLIPE